MAADRLFRVRITYPERVETETPGVSVTREHIREELVPTADYWRVYRELLDLGALPEVDHELKVWEVKRGGV